MKNIRNWSTMLLALLLGACGGGDGTLTGGPGGGGGGSTATNIALIASSTQLASASNVPVELTAIITDSNGGAVEGALVTFNTGGDTGAQLSPTSTVLTNANGLAQVALTSLNNPRNRAITVTGALTAGPSAAVTVNVVGTSLQITGPDALGIGDSANYTVFLANSENQPLAGRTVTLTSDNGNTITAGNLVTGPGGTVTFTLTANNADADVITATALGASATKVVAVSDDSFTIISPTPGQEIPLGNVVNFTIEWVQDGLPVVGQSVNFASARGTLSAASAVTNGSGQATVTLSSNSAGVSGLSVFDPVGGAGTSIDVEFVALVADTLILQSQFNNLVPGQTTTLTARIEDPNGNAVKNKTVLFALPNDDTNGELSPLQAITDSNGIARSFYTAGPISSGTGAVTVSATVSDTPGVNDSRNLTVGGQAFSFDIGTGNSIEEPSQTLYAKEWAIVVTDANSNPVANTTVQVSAPPTRYRKGWWEVAGNVWVQNIRNTCLNEDANRNGQLDPGEDFNGDGILWPGNVVSVAPIPANQPLNAGCSVAQGTGASTTQVSTNSIGVARVCLFYNQDKAYWAEVDLTATAGVSGTESSASAVHWLTGAASDYNNPDIPPPGQFSPFGQADQCEDPS